MIKAIEFLILSTEMDIKILLYLLLSLLTITIGCRTPAGPIIIKPAYNRPLLPGQHALRKVTNPAQIPDFTSASLDLHQLSPTIKKSLNYLKKSSSKRYFPVSGITHRRAVDSLEAFLGLLDSGHRGADLNAAIRDKFDVYMSVGCDDQGTVLYTGYYTPIFDGSFEPSARFSYPLYKQPVDLVKGPDGEIFGQRGGDGTIRPYPSRAVIEDQMLFKGNELVWLSDRFEVYIAHVQGSAKIRLPNGRISTVGYAANNGHEYKSIMEELVKDGRISSSQMSLAAMIDYFGNHPDQVARYTQMNPRFVFFQKEQGEPRGSLNEPVTPMRTIATDKSIFPRGCLAFIYSTLPQVKTGQVVLQPYSGFALDQDTGGAIRAPGRCDIYIGQGDTAGELAGRIYQEGKLYYLFLKSGGPLAQ
ncbi:MAG: murein transglycosylase [Planctomycetes bacterium]|nr:murein transglycosylase [Planctomycetota bacterium]